MEVEWGKGRGRIYNETRVYETLSKPAAQALLSILRPPFGADLSQSHVSISSSSSSSVRFLSLSRQRTLPHQMRQSPLLRWASQRRRVWRWGSRIKEPTIEVIEGTFDDKFDAYEDTIKVKISNDDENVRETNANLSQLVHRRFRFVDGHFLLFHSLQIELRQPFYCESDPTANTTMIEI